MDDCLILQSVFAALLLAEFLGLAFALRKLGGVPWSVAPALSAAMIVLFLFVADFAGGLRAASYCLHATGLVAVVYALRLQWKSGRLNIKSLYSEGAWLSAFLLFYIFSLFVLNRGGAFSSWDEFSHWGTIIRAISEENTFHFSPTPIYFEDYPPGAALFVYHALTLIGYSEGNAFFANSVLLLFFLFPVISAARTVSDSFTLFVLATLSYMIFILGSGWASVLIDQTLSILFAGTVAAYFHLQHQRRSLFVIPVLLGSLALTKQTGLMLALFAATICLVDTALLRVIGERNTNGSSQPSISKDILWVGILFAFPILAWTAWQQHIATLGLSQSLASRSVTALFKQSLDCCATPKDVDIAGKFFSAVLGIPPPPTNEVRPLFGYARDAFARVDVHTLLLGNRDFVVGRVWFFMGASSLLAAALFPTWRQRGRFFAFSLVMAAGAIIYSFSLLLFYLYGFSEYEGRQLASFDRYHNVISLAWVVLLLYVVSELLRSLEHRRLRHLVFLVIACVSFYVVSPEPVRSFYAKGAQGLSEERRFIRDWTDRITPYIPRSARVFVGWQGSVGRELWIVRYELLPRPSNFSCYSLGPPTRADDIYTCNLKRDEVEKLLSEYDYYAIGKGLKSLRLQYGQLFDDAPADADAALFRVDNSSRSLRLVYVPTN